MKLAWLAATAAIAYGPAALAADAPARDLTQAPRMGTWGFDLAGRDVSVSPAQDLYEHANGTYQKRLEIPADRSWSGVPIALDELSKARLRAIVEASAADKAATGASAKVGAFYRSYIDEARIEALGATPLAADLNAVKAARTRTDIARLMGQTSKGYGLSFFSITLYDDAREPMRYAAYLGQGGLTLPNRDYYLEARFAPQRQAYEAYITRALTLAGWPDAAAQAKAILALETEVAKVSWSRAAQRDNDKTYNPYTRAELARLAPGFDWTAFFAGADLGALRRVVVQENTAFPKIAAIYSHADPQTLKSWLAFTIIDQAAPYLSRDFDQARFAFRGTALSGIKAQSPRWKRGVTLVDSEIGEAVGQVYVKAYFPPAHKAQVLALVKDLQSAMAGRIERLDWMSAETKAQALQKLSKMTVKIGYPDAWRDYSALELRDDDLYGNVQRTAAFEWGRKVARMDKPVDRSEWWMTPATVNAYYAPTKNEIVFPAAILQPPFFDPDADPAVNYGAIGGVIGHEITHGFDDQGRKLDGDGRLTDWWTKDDAARFQERAAKLGAQYGATEVLPGLKINPDLTMGENIADLGGLLMALDAYHLSLKGKPAPIIDGLTGDQRLFLAYAQSWRGKMRDDLLKQILVSDPHAPMVARGNIPPRNIDAYYEAFGVKPGDAMYVPPEKRAHIW